MSDTDVSKKQSVSGFKIKGFNVKKGKDTETLKISLEAEVDSIGAGDYDLGEVMKALLNHSTSETEVGLTVFVK